jgi:phage-related protein
MFNVILYEKADGTSPVRELLDDLNSQSWANKSARVRRNKIISYIDALAQCGSGIGMPIAEHLDGEIWELRPIDDRILYFFAKNNTYVLLHHFIKKTQKTPPREIEKAKREMQDHIERNK